MGRPALGDPVNRQPPPPSQAILRRLLEAAAHRRLALGAVVAVVSILAVLSLLRMPVQLLPEIRYPQIRVISDLPGQTARVVEESVNEPIEAALGAVPGIIRLESRSGDGRSYLDLFFAPGADLDRALNDVTQAVQRARGQIPSGFPEPRVFAVSTLQEPALEIAVGSPALDVPEIRRRLRGTLLPRLRGVAGVEAVYMGREEIPELAVDVNPGRQVAAAIRLEDLESVLLDATRPPLSSALRAPGFEGVGVLGVEGWSPTWLAAQPVPARGGALSVPLGSVATVSRGPSEERLFTRLDGVPSVLLSIHRSPRGHALRVSNEVREVLAELEGTALFADLEATILFDDAVVTRSAVWSTATAVMGGALLAMLLLLVALGQRRYAPLVAVVVGAGLAAALVALSAAGQTLNLLTLAGLLLSVGLGLDYAIIYFDRLDRSEKDEGAPHIRAMEEVAGPLLGALLTTLAAVLPFLLVEGMVALLFRPLIWTVVAAGIFSFLFALLILPAFARQTGAARTGEKERDSILRHPRLAPLRSPWGAWGGAVGLAVILVVGGRSLPFEVLPVVDDGFVDVRIVHPSGIPLAGMDRIARSMEEALRGVEGTAALSTTVGGYFREGLPAFRPASSDFMVRVGLGEGGVTSERWAREAREAAADMGIPGLQVTVTPPRIRGVQTRLADDDVIVVLSRDDGDLLALAELETPVVERLREVPGLTGVRRLRGGASPRWQGTPRLDRLTAVGMGPAGLEQAMAYALEGRVLAERMEGGEPLALRIRYDRRVAGGPDALASVPILAGETGSLRLADVVDFQLVEEPTHIERREGNRVVRVAGQLDPAGPGASEVARSVRNVLREADLPEGTRWWLEGEIDAIQETSRTFGVSLGLALLLVLAVLSVQYGSLAFAVAGVLTIPLTAAGAVALLAILGRPLDGMVLAGLLIAVGIVANNVILVLSEAARMGALSGPGEGLPLREALERAADSRLRPITLTVLSTALGMSPLLLGGVEVFGLLQPLAIALIGSLLLSIPVACLILPGIAASLAGLRTPGPATPRESPDPAPGGGGGSS
ncbi:MAG: efflux RND transporter permease subunit [Gemmatimonadales bacterium]|nr:MAG: efflux RND transporter permease subunit [Gemmatimonadales bacterium]